MGPIVPEILQNRENKIKLVFFILVGSILLRGTPTESTTGVRKIVEYHGKVPFHAGILPNIGMSYTFGKLLRSTFQRNPMFQRCANVFLRNCYGRP